MKLTQFFYSDENRRQVNARDLKMTWTILMVCLCYFVFVMPISVINMADPHADHAELHLVRPFIICIAEVIFLS
jgi:hypothetical protein